MPSSNPRYARYAERAAARKRIKALGLPCGICGKPIDYTLTTYTDPRDGKVKRHPLSFEVDEIVPISKGGSATDMSNLRPVHRICNQRRGNGTSSKSKRLATEDNRKPSREW